MRHYGIILCLILKTTWRQKSNHKALEISSANTNKTMQHFLLIDTVVVNSWLSFSIYFTLFTRIFTDGNKTLHTLLVEHYNDYFDRQSCGRSWGVVT